MAFTFFFRDLYTIELAVNQLLPIISGRNRPRLWDAGCAMGPEPFTLAIVLAEKMGRFAFNNLRIDATDIDESGQFGQIVTAGVYPYDQLERIPVPLFEAYFKPNGQPGHFQIDERIRSRVAFRRHNLLGDPAPGDGYSLVLCKNVLLHFNQAERERVSAMFHDVLLPGGLLVMEQTQKLPGPLLDRFEQVTVDAQIYRKLPGAGA
jgi:chemotaxis protein methyltransferase CheR